MIARFLLAIFCGQGCCGKQSANDTEARVSVVFEINIRGPKNNEKNAFIVQRRSIVANKDLPSGHVITESDLDFLRPCPENSFHPYEAKNLIGKKLLKAKKKNESLLKDEIC